MRTTPERWRQISQIFDEALRRSPDSRDEFLRDVSGADLDLRREVESLLVAHEAAGSFGDVPVALIGATLEPGSVLGPYRIDSLLGAGGMGEVYRAHDVRLGRSVAIKVLPLQVASSRERLAAFDREARVLASLNHPHIAAIYGVETSADGPALVMELVEGEDLSERIARGPIRLADALPMAAQIAEALEAAHEQGIIHRDLKPANIKVRDDGTIKVLDFGLARALDPLPSETGDSGRSPSMLGHPTRAGVIPGTAAYMSPEQARGRPADKRADIWAFGAVLYEMLTGRTLYAGETTSEILARVIEHEPDLSALPTATPAAIRALLGRCLTKDPRTRLQAIGEARIVIDRAVVGVQELSSDPALGGVRDAATAVPGKRTTRHTPLAWTVAALALAGMAVLAVPAIRHWRVVDVAGPEERLQVVTPPAAGDPRSFSISPDGLRLVFSATVDGKTQLWIRPLAALTAQPLSGTDSATLPFWRPDSLAIGFFAEGKLKWILASGGSPTTVVSVQHPQGGSWNRNGDIIFAPHVTEPLWRVSSIPGSPPPVPVTRLQPSGQSGHWSPWFLPDGRHFVYQATGNAEGRGIYLGALDSPEVKRLTDADLAAVYAPPGFLLFARQGKLLAQHLDLETLTLTGDTLVVAEPPSFRGGGLSCSLATGALVYRDGSGTTLQLAWLDRSGKLIAPVGSVHTSLPFGLDLSSDGTRVALDRGDAEGNRDIFVLETMRTGMTRLTDNAAGDFYPVWSPDGRRLAYSSTRQTGVMQLWERPANETGAETQLLASPQALLTPKDWSHDGGFLLYIRVDPETGADLWALPMTGARGGQPFPVATSVFNERDGQFSPDGKWIAYTSNRLGHYEIYAQPFPGPGGAIPVSTAGGIQPRWPRDGQELFYIALDGWMTAVPMALGSDGQSLRVGTPTRLFPSRIAYSGIAQTHLHAVANGGQKFLIEQETAEGTATLVVVKNWQAGAK